MTVAEASAEQGSGRCQFCYAPRYEFELHNWDLKGQDRPQVKRLLWERDRVPLPAATAPNGEADRESPRFAPPPCCICRGVYDKIRGPLALDSPLATIHHFVREGELGRNYLPNMGLAHKACNHGLNLSSSLLSASPFHVMGACRGQVDATRESERMSTPQTEVAVRGSSTEGWLARAEATEVPNTEKGWLAEMLSRGPTSSDTLRRNKRQEVPFRHWAFLSEQARHNGLPRTRKDFENMGAETVGCSAQTARRHMDKMLAAGLFKEDRKPGTTIDDTPVKITEKGQTQLGAADRLFREMADAGEPVL